MVLSGIKMNKFAARLQYNLSLVRSVISAFLVN